MSSVSPWLDLLVAPLDLETFRRETWTKRSHFDGPRPERLALLQSLFPSPRIEDVLQGFAGDVRVWISTPVGALKTVDLPVAQALDLHACGLTLYAVGHPVLSPYAETLSRVFDCHAKGVQGSIFANRAGTSTPMHFDANENFTLQLAGRKRWYVAPNEVVTNPMDNWISGTEVGGSLPRYTSRCLHRAVPRPTQTYDLEPGSLLYLPRGWWHGTDANDDACVSINFSLRPTTWFDVALGAVATLMIKSPRWRAAAHGFEGGDTGAVGELRALLRSLAASLETLDPRDVLGHVEGGRAEGAGHRYNPLSSLSFEQVDPSGARAVVQVTTDRPLGARITRFEAEDELVAACMEITEAALEGHEETIDWRARLSDRLSADDIEALLEELEGAGFLKAAR